MRGYATSIQIRKSVRYAPKPYRPLLRWSLLAAVFLIAGSAAAAFLLLMR